MRGGRRSGAGRKAGSVTTRTREIADAASSAGVTPLEYMLGVMRDKDAPVERRDDMAKASAKFMHATFAAVEHTGKDGGPLQVSVLRFTDA